MKKTWKLAKIVVLTEFKRSGSLKRLPIEVIGDGYGVFCTGGHLVRVVLSKTTKGRFLLRPGGNGMGSGMNGRAARLKYFTGE